MCDEPETGHEKPVSGLRGIKESREMEDSEEKKEILKSFIGGRGLVRQHLDSFDHFVNDEMKKIVKAAGNQFVRCDADHSFYVKYNDIWVGKPCTEEQMCIKDVTPHQCRLRDITYSSPVFVDIEYTKGNQKHRAESVQIGKLPIMLRSDKCILSGKNDSELSKLGECPMDPGGYFIVKGQEKVILIQEQLAKNRIIVEIDKTGVTGSVTSTSHERKSRTNVILKHDKYFVKHHTFEIEVNIAAIFKGMGLESDQEIVQLVGTEQQFVESLIPTLQDCSQNLKIFTQIQALEYLGRHIRARTYRKPGVRGSMGFRYYSSRRPKSQEARECLSGVLFPHVPATAYDFAAKRQYLAVVLRRVITAVHDKSALDDKDYSGNKRLELAGQMMALLFEDLFKRFNKDLARIAEQNLNKPNRAAQFDIIKSISNNSITHGFVYALSTGNWNVRRWKMERHGVTQVLSRLSYVSALGMMTRIQSHVEKTRKISGPRALQASSWGMICPSDTPEGENCGLVKNLALLTYITTTDEFSPTLASTILPNLGLEHPNLHSHSSKHFLVFVNGNIVGTHSRPNSFIQSIRSLRRAGRLSPFTSIYLQRRHRYVQISTDGGRVCRPLILINTRTGKPRVTQRHLQELSNGLRSFDDFLREGLIEFLDVNEENDSEIALYPHQITTHTTHVEIDPLTILGVCAGIIPYPNHNQSPRNTYQCAMGKQAIGTIAYNQFDRVDTLIYLLVYPQKPLVKTHTIELVNFDKMPAGQNAIIAVMSYSGYDIEDAIVLNKASIDRGFGRCITLRKHVTNIKKYPNQTSDKLVGPPTEKNSTGAKKYSHIDKDGLCQPGDFLDPHDILVNKHSPLNSLETVGDTDLPDSAYRPNPVTFKAPERSYVDKVLLTSTEDGTMLIKVLMRSVRRPELGDKFSSRHGQKGVCGIIANQEDLPFTSDGIVPDLIMNPHGFPSRMTVGNMMELLGSKAAVLDGKTKYGTVFAGDPAEYLSEVLVQNGYHYSGKDVLTSGITGEQLEGYIFFGPVYYQKLKHMVTDKIHSRSRGPRAVLTRQPTEGRAREGGFRLGEMEKDCLIAYGTTALLVERLMYSSDVFTVYICKSCGLLAFHSHCPTCGHGKTLHSIDIPYACKLLFQELQAMNIIPRITLDDPSR